MTNDQHTTNSSYREVLLEHLLVGEIMRRLWLRGITQFEVLKPQVDDSGYDIVFEANRVTRHIQLKSSFRGSSTKQVRLSLKLQEKPSACAVWMVFDKETMALGSFLWFGSNPGEPIPSLYEMKVAKHTRGNSKGVKKERPAQRSIPKARFETIADLDTLVTRLFGEFKNVESAA